MEAVDNEKTKVGDEIASLLRDPNSRVRNNAAWALSFASSEIVGPSLIAALDDTEADVPGNAAYALGCIGSIYVIPALVETLSDEHETVRASSSKSLCYLACLRDGKSLSFEIALKMAVPAVIKALEDDATEVRTNIISFLEQIQSQDAVARLVNLLQDPVADVRARAA
jgi:HEAT repeat protein